MTNEHARPEHPGAPIGEVHLFADEPDAEPAQGQWSARNVPLAALALLIMVGALLLILIFAYQLVPE